MAGSLAGWRTFQHQIVVHNNFLGGGFGRRLEVDGVATAVRIARHVSSPVEVMWSREEDIQQENYRPRYHNRMAARDVARWALPEMSARQCPSLLNIEAPFGLLYGNESE
jgi:CO/xanthine dehydrogenase Mo-binding subunit